MNAARTSTGLAGLAAYRRRRASYTKKKAFFLVLATSGFLVAGAEEARAVAITLQQGAATFSQSSFSVDEAINGVITSGSDGWAIASPTTASQTEGLPILRTATPGS